MSGSGAAGGAALPVTTAALAAGILAHHYCGLEGVAFPIALIAIAGGAAGLMGRWRQHSGLGLGSRQLSLSLPWPWDGLRLLCIRPQDSPPGSVTTGRSRDVLPHWIIPISLHGWLWIY